MRRRHFTIWLLLALVCLGSRVDASESSMMERAFVAWVERAGLGTGDEVLVAQVSCGGEVCMRFNLPAVRREQVLVQMVEIAAGFGSGADVVEATMAVDRFNHEQASLTVVIREKRGGPNAKQRLRMANSQVALLRVLAGIHDPLEAPIDFKKLRRGTRFYFIAGLNMYPQKSTVTLVAPSGASGPSLADRIDGAPGCSCTPHVAAGATLQTGFFARWQTFHLRCRWVCTPGSKTIE